MARERATINVDIWSDGDFRDLTDPAQSLYFKLTSHPGLSYCGVTDWHPGRIAKLSRGTTASYVRAAAEELSSTYFCVFDLDTDEVLVRSFLRHDGLLSQPRLAVSAAKAYGAIASNKIRAVVVHELQRHKAEKPDLAAWEKPQMITVLKQAACSARDTGTGMDLPLEFDFGKGYGQGSDETLGKATGSATTSTSTATSTSTEASLPAVEAKLKETRLPADWVPQKSHFDLAQERRVDIAAQVEAFRLHAATYDRHAARWNAAFTTWLKKSAPSTAPPASRRVGGPNGLTPEQARAESDARAEEMLARNAG